MKRIFYLIAIVAIAVSSLCGCIDKIEKSQEAVDTLRIDSICYDTLFSYGKGKDAPVCEISIHFPFASGANADELNDSLLNFIEGAKHGEALTRDYFTRMLAHGADEFLQLFRSDIDDAAEDSPDYMRGAGYYLNVRYSVADAPDSILVCKIEESSYTGGAHGSYMESYLNVDRATGHVISLSDICAPGQEPQLIDAIVKQFLTDYKCDSLKQLQEEHMIFLLCDEPVVASQFYFSETGVTFVYNEYEIAPYSEGVITTTVPYATMKAFAPKKK